MEEKNVMKLVFSSSCFRNSSDDSVKTRRGSNQMEQNLGNNEWMKFFSRCDLYRCSKGFPKSNV